MRRLGTAVFWIVVAGWTVLGALVLFAMFGVTTPALRGFATAPASTDTPGVAAPATDAAPFTVITRVLQSSRCVNCHPIGDRPLRADGPGVHAMNISRTSLENGLRCSTCHREQNSEAVGIAGGPPGAPHWGLPPAETPMVFESRSERELCRQLTTRSATGGRSLTDLLEHVSADSLVLWAWAPGGARTPPPYSHEAFVAAFTTWVESGGSCEGTAEQP
jgi:hypothetical protein